MHKPSMQELQTAIEKFTRCERERVTALTRSRKASWAAVLLLAIVTVLLTTVSFEQIPVNLKEGMIAARNIKADRNYEIVDEEATQKFRDEAMGAIPAVFDLDRQISETLLRRLHEAFVLARRGMDAARLPGKGGARPGGKVLVDEAARGSIERAFAEKLGIAPTPAMWGVLWGEGFGERIEVLLANLLRRAMDRPILAEREVIEAERGRGVALRHLAAEPAEGGERRIEEETNVDATKLSSAEEVRHQIGQMAVPAAGLLPPESESTIAALAQLLVEPNCSLDRQETERRRETAAATVKNVILKVNAGEMIIREGSRYEPWHLKVLDGIRREKRRGMASVEFLGTLLLVVLFLLLPFMLVLRGFRRIRVQRSDWWLMALVGLSVVGLMRLSLLLAPAIQETLFPGIAVSSLAFAIPIAGGAMLLRMFLGAEIVLVFSVVLSVLAGLFVETDYGFAAFCLLSNVTAAIAIAHTDRRSAIIKAGFLTGLVGALAVAGIQLVGLASARETATLADALWSVLFGFTSGMGSAIFAMIATPIVESVSDYTSDIKLLELANLNHPLLRELIVRAPGTYHHSHMTGVLGEAAAEAIRANALIVRVAAYYHDIGKIRKPLYFIENAKPGENKHERLSPHMSALIVAAHVKEGLEMVEREGVPRAIAEMIPQHHGTRLISFFYEKAKEMENAAVERVDPKDFMYSGPIPQTREAAILMLADAVEAAVRSLKEKGATRIQQTVQRVITDIFMEKQLDDCELTLKDLNEIARAFIRTLLGIYHARIEYPKDADHEREKPEISIIDGGPPNENPCVQPLSRPKAGSSEA